MAACEFQARRIPAEPTQGTRAKCEEAIASSLRALGVVALAKTTLNFIHVLRTRGRGVSLPASAVRALDLTYGPAALVQVASWKLGTIVLEDVCGLPPSLTSPVAGFFSGSALALVPAESRQGIALVALVRGLLLLCRAMNSRGVFPAWVSSMGHWDVVLMCAAATQILYCGLYDRFLLEPTYRRFIKHFNGIDIGVVDVVRAAHRGQPASIPSVVACCERLGLAPMYVLHRPDGSPDLCRLLHPHTGCAGHFVDHACQGFPRALAVYAPLHLLLAVVGMGMRRSRLAAQPGLKAPLGALSPGRDEGPPPAATDAVRLLTRTALSTLRSSLFLAVYCACAWSVAHCVSSRVVGGRLLPHVNRAALALPGLAVLLEVKARRLELALYCLTKALQCAWAELAAARIVTPIPGGECVVFGLGLSVLCWCWTHSAHDLKPTLRMLLGLLWS